MTALICLPLAMNDTAFSRAQRRFDAQEPDYMTDAEERDEAALAAFSEHFGLSAYNQQKIRMVLQDQRIADSAP